MYVVLIRTAHTHELTRIVTGATISITNEHEHDIVIFTRHMTSCATHIFILRRHRARGEFRNETMRRGKYKYPLDEICT